MSKKYQNLDKTVAFGLLKQVKEAAMQKRGLSPESVRKYVICQNGLSFSYAASQVNEVVLDLFQKLSEEQELIGRYARLLSGDEMNSTEHRPVLHHKTRSGVPGFYQDELERAFAFSRLVSEGGVLTYQGFLFEAVVQVGIGGSHLGPMALQRALHCIVKPRLHVEFISNVDPDDAHDVLSRVDIHRTLFIVVSKSGNTLETAANMALIKRYAMVSGIPESEFYRHLVVVTMKDSELDLAERHGASFYLDHAIGGRYSSTSVVGTVVLSLVFGETAVRSFLSGAHAMDESCKIPEVRNNSALMAALIGVYERNVCGYSSRAVIPYSEALTLFPAHLQQLECESNGKRVNIYGEVLSYSTGPVVFGESGTDSQHAFFQTLHQGSDVIPVQFIGFKKSQIDQDVVFQGTTSQEKLNANVVAQIVALSIGNPGSSGHQEFPGNRPSTFIFADQLTPFILGVLLSFYENMVMFQGFLWNINSFDQEGVQFGKVLATQLLNNDQSVDPLLKAYRSLIFE